MEHRRTQPVQSRSGFAAASIAGAILLAAGSASAQSPVLERMVELYGPPDEYHLFDDDRKQVVAYKEERVIRICAGDSRHLVPLKVSFDGETATVARNDCLRVEAKEVFLEPARPLDENWVIEAEVETLG